MRRKITKQNAKTVLAKLLASEEPSDSKELVEYYEDLSSCHYLLENPLAQLMALKKLALFSPTPMNHNKLGATHYRLLDYPSAKEQLILAYRADSSNSTTFNNICTFVAQQAEFELALQSPAPKVDYIHRLKTIIDFAKTCIDQERADVFSFTNNITILDSCIDFNEHYIVKVIFDTTKSVEERGYIRACLLTLYNDVLTLKNAQKASLSGTQMEICHYTRTENLKSLVNKDKVAYLRLYNAAYMNDPSEGKVFHRLMAQCSSCQMRHSDSEYPRGQRVYHSYGYSNTYLGSFSANIDSLPMWVQYGNGGCGCCLLFDEDFFDQIEPFSDPSILGLSLSSKADGSDPMSKERYVLYKVEYITESGESQHRELLCHIARQYQELDNLISELNYSDQKQICWMADTILDQIRFLFKDQDYAYEQEYRVIKFSDAPCCDKGERSGEMPHLYIDLMRPLKYKEIILGPKVEHPSEIAPYLHYTGKVKRITKSTIKYQ